LVLIVAAALIAPRGLYAAPTYGTEMPQKGRVTMGYQANAVFKHDLSDSYGNIKSEQQFFDISYGVFDWLSVEGRAGVGNLLQKGGIHPKVSYRNGFAGGYGFRLLALNDEKNKIKTVVGFHHISVHPENRVINGDKYESLLDDWQISLVASRAVGIVTPFLGGKVSRFDLVYKVNEIDRKRRPPRYYAGLVAGCGVRLPGGFSVTVEGHFIDESSLSAGAYWTF
jgi:hypothetical protein